MYLWNECQALVSNEAYVSLVPRLLAHQEPRYEARPMRVRLAGGSRKISISTRADLAKKEGRGSQKNEVREAAYLFLCILR